ncbi:hypothetical protein E2C01_064712 [Portunus trituberculatus]|uniref:Uncharacterized protein n=1 Tax=Portunus trituberculatus TaxID=210409 RepID=A0A5B7HGW2_PORTR|nr:hypothetical protein [Portunus trituberculatus]
MVALRGRKAELGQFAAPLERTAKPDSLSEVYVGVAWLRPAGRRTLEWDSGSWGQKSVRHENSGRGGGHARWRDLGFRKRECGPSVSVMLALRKPGVGNSGENLIPYELILDYMTSRAHRGTDAENSGANSIHIKIHMTLHYTNNDDFHTYTSNTVVIGGSLFTTLQLLTSFRFVAKKE